MIILVNHQTSTIQELRDMKNTRDMQKWLTVLKREISRQSENKYLIQRFDEIYLNSANH
jgi:hypothetical protein